MGNSYVVVMRAPAAVFFPEGEQLLINGFPTAAGKVNIRFASRWLAVSDTDRMPGHMWIHVEGVAADLELALSVFANAGISFLPLLSVAFNAAIHEGEVELGFDSSPGCKAREYFQTYLTPESKLPYAFRRAKADLAADVCMAVAAHADVGRLLRAANQYRLALESWKQGRETLATAHLWMAIEALTKVQVRTLMLALGKNSQQDLADHLGVDLKLLDAHVRKHFLFEGDDASYAASKKASDGFEHGFMDFGQMREHGVEVRHKLANYVRVAVLRLANVPAATSERLREPPFDKPLGLWPLAKYIRGTLEGELENLAAEGQAYPFVRWNPTLKSWALDADGKVQAQLTNSFTAELGTGTTFNPQSFEAWQQA